MPQQLSPVPQLLTGWLGKALLSRWTVKDENEIAIERAGEEYSEQRQEQLSLTNASVTDELIVSIG